MARRKQGNPYDRADREAEKRLRALAAKHPRTYPDKYVQDIATEVAQEYGTKWFRYLKNSRSLYGGLNGIVIDLERLEEFGLLDTDSSVSYFREGDLAPGLGTSPSTSIHWLVTAELYMDLTESLREVADSIDSEREAA